MNCRHCGTPIADDGIFCSGCGKAVENRYVTMESINWVYITFEKYSSAGEYLDEVMDSAEVSEKSARLRLWLKHKPGIVNALRPFLEQGWQPISELDSSCLIINWVIKSSSEHPGVTLNLVSADEYSWWLVGVKVPLRREWKDIPVQT